MRQRNILLQHFSAIVLAGALSAAWGHDPQARYLGNAGVMVSAGSEKIVFDAFFDVDYGQYLLVAPETRAALIADQPPYDGLAAAFVSHVHGDHFSTAPMLAFVAANPKVRVFAPQQVVDALRRESDDPALLSHVVGFDLEPGDEPARLRAGSMDIAAVAIPHAGGQRNADIQNLFFAVRIADRASVLHMGDAGPDPNEFERQRAFFEAWRFDLIFPPYWFFADETGRFLLARFFATAQPVGVHVPERAGADPTGWRRALDADLFIEPGETRLIGQGAP
ncbi:MAG: MBL fold metallo-hydrolase [Xanthomonadales bacterium]|nr:MBL fold metallo-hydrolase [Xanthomonadales bacterium]